MKKLIVIFLIGLSFPIYAKSELNHSRYFLKNYGFAYCMQTFGQSDWLKQDAGAAESIYFQSGKHHGKAYRQVSSYMEREFPKMKISDSQGNALVLYKCLEIYHSKKYNRFILQLDKYYF